MELYHRIFEKDCISHRIKKVRVELKKVKDYTLALYKSSSMK